MLILDDPTTWPRHLTTLLTAQPFTELLKAHEYVDDLIVVPAAQEISYEVERYAEAEGVAAFHCTKQARGLSYSETGLRVLDFVEHHLEFLARIREHPAVDGELLQHIEQQIGAWREHHTGQREGLLWFCDQKPGAGSWHEGLLQVLWR